MQSNCIVSWVALQQDLDQKGQGYRRQQDNCILGKVALEYLVSAQLPKRAFPQGLQYLSPKFFKSLTLFFILHNQCRCKKKILIKQKKHTNEPLQAGFGARQFFAVGGHPVPTGWVTAFMACTQDMLVATHHQF